MRDSDRQSEFRAAHSPLHGRRGDKPRSLQGAGGLRACAALMLCAATADSLCGTDLHHTAQLRRTDGAFPMEG